MFNIKISLNRKELDFKCNSSKENKKLNMTLNRMNQQLISMNKQFNLKNKFNDMRIIFILKNYVEFNFFCIRQLGTGKGIDWKLIANYVFLVC